MASSIVIGAWTTRRCPCSLKKHRDPAAYPNRREPDGVAGVMRDTFRSRGPHPVFVTAMAISAVAAPAASTFQSLVDRCSGLISSSEGMAPPPRGTSPLAG
jgi:hypothetical protein